MTDLDFLLGILELKDEERAWIELFNIRKSESVADHSWSTAFLTLLFGKDRDIDLEKALKIAVIHDLAEAEIGDIANRAEDEDRNLSSEEKQRREKETWNKWDRKLYNPELKQLWLEYEGRETPEARLVKDMDLTDLCLQSLNYEAEDSYSGSTEPELEKLDEVFENSINRTQTELGDRILSQLEEGYILAKKGQKPELDPDLKFAYKVLKLKDEKRTGWQLRKVEKPESVADHSWSSAFLCMFLADHENVNEKKCMKMALVHDLEQAELGDIPSRRKEKQMKMTTSEKEQKEIEAISETVPEEQKWIEELWNEHRKMETDEAVFVEDMEQLDMALQALKYEKNNRYDRDKENPHFEETEAMDEFLISADENIRTETARQLFKKIKQEYEKVRQR